MAFLSPPLNMGPLLSVYAPYIYLLYEGASYPLLEDPNFTPPPHIWRAPFFRGDREVFRSVFLFFEIGFTPRVCNLAFSKMLKQCYHLGMFI